MRKPPPLVEWNREQRSTITGLQSVEREALQERILVSEEAEMARLTAHLNRLEAVLATRNMECLSTESLFVMAATVRAQLRRLATPPVFPARSPVSGVEEDRQNSLNEPDPSRLNSVNPVHPVPPSAPASEPESAQNRSGLAGGRFSPNADGPGEADSASPGSQPSTFNAQPTSPDECR
jgi:hypothetical protein